VAGRYRALLIGNSSYPADEHNLQTLKGPVKDIAALNRALSDPDAGLFADTDVTLLPEATSSRAIRALGRFFGSAARDDVLLVYFSGHGKLDHGGRLHLCMQDTDSTDLLSTAVSSTRINEFADASLARNVVIVLDCCYAGAFRGSDLGQPVAGPGRYVLTSCRGTQLANDATVENGTSFFTQHLVDGLLRSAVDQDQDGYITFSDLYTYIDRRLREAGKQIPQRRVDGDGDLPLAKRPARPAAQADAATHAHPPHPPHPPQLERTLAKAGPASDTSAATTSAHDTSGSARKRTVLLAAAATAVAAVAGVVVAFALSSGGPGGGPGSHTTGTGTYVAAGPWRLKMDDNVTGYDPGCMVTLKREPSGQPVPLPTTGLYGTPLFQISLAGSFRWQVNNAGCLVAPVAGSGMDQLPLVWVQPGDSDAFAAGKQLAVRVKDYSGHPDCLITLRDPDSGQVIDFKTATRGKDNDTVVLDATGHSTAYVSNLSCAVRVSVV